MGVSFDPFSCNFGMAFGMGSPLPGCLPFGIIFSNGSDTLAQDARFSYTPSTDMFAANNINCGQKFGLGVTPAAQQNGGPLSATILYTVNEQTMINRMWSAMKTFGFIS